MKRIWTLILVMSFGFSVLFKAFAVAEETAAEPVAVAPDTQDPELIKAEPTEPETAKPVSTKKTPKKKVEKANGFIAKSDWEFDGFVAGGQDQTIKSMFHLNDYVYLNVGTQQGFETGDQITVYKRGERIRDPQSGRFIGYEVRRAAVSEITDKLEDETCVARILKSYEAVEIGDLIKRQD